MKNLLKWLGLFAPICNLLSRACRTKIFRGIVDLILNCCQIINWGDDVNSRVDDLVRKKILYFVVLTFRSRVYVIKFLIILFFSKVFMMQ